MKFKIYNFTFEINNHAHLLFPDNILKFKIDDSCFCEYTYDLYITDKIDILETAFTYSLKNIRIIVSNQLEKRYLFLDSTIPYAYLEEKDDFHSIIYVHKMFLNDFSIDPIFISLLSLERRMYLRHAFILHSSFIVNDNQAILFTAPSGTGKSTQASLWEKYRDAKVINGDRSLLVKEDQNYYAYGWPVCGSSKICLNENYPLLCIVVLSQGNTNKIERLKPAEAFRKLLSEITINYHNEKFVYQVSDFLDELIRKLPIYHLTCDMSEEAVNCLEKELTTIL